MGFRKCPICEVNYIKDDEQCCDVCRRYKKGEHDPEPDDTAIVCIECGENPAVKGRELCAACLRESMRQAKLAEGDESLSGVSGVMTDVELMGDEVPLPGASDIPESELVVIHKELGGDDEPEDDIDDDAMDEFDDAEDEQERHV